MSQWETCKIESARLREEKPFFGAHASVYQYRAVKITPTGETEIIACSEEHRLPMGLNSREDREEEEKLERGYERIIAYLLQEGWEPAATTDHGRVTLMKRQVTESTNNVSLLQQLANLRDAGILTEQEFQNKKAEILKRV